MVLAPNFPVYVLAQILLLIFLFVVISLTLKSERGQKLLNKYIYIELESEKQI
jgi:hypothetical protein